MSTWTDLRQRLGAALRPAKTDLEHTEEARFHLDMLAERYRQRGLSPADAMRRAHLDFGPVQDVRERTRDARGAAFMGDVQRDLQVALRQYRARPLFSAILVLTIAMGTGITVAAYSAVDTVLRRPLPFASPEQLVMLWETDQRSGTTREPASWPDLLDIRARTRTLRAVEGFMGADVTLATGTAEPMRVTGLVTTGGFAAALGIAPRAGRWFSPEHARPGGPAVALLSESLWRTRFSGDPDIVGSVIRLNEQPVTVLGVMPDEAETGLDQIHAQAAYHATYESAGSVDVWLPLQASAEELPRTTHPILMFGRLAEGATPASATGEVSAIMRDLERQYPENTARGIHIESLDAVVLGPSRPLLRVVLAAGALLLLVAIVNAATLLLSRSVARTRETAVRVALGAGRARLIRQFVVESAVLVMLGTGLGLLLAGALVRFARRYGPADVPRLATLDIAPAAIWLAIGVTAVIVVALAIVPAWVSLRSDRLAALRDGAARVTAGGAAGVLRNLLVMTELALCIALGICTGLMVRSLDRLAGIDPGFRADGVVKAQYQLPASRYPRNFAVFPHFVEIAQFTQRLLEEVRRVPGVTAATIAAAHPLDEGFTNSWRVVGREAEAADWPEISVRVVTDGYAETMGQTVTAGRSLSASDDAAAPPVALINRAAAERFFPGQSPLGQQIWFWGIARRIVGVVTDERIHGIASVAPPATYIAFAQAPSNTGVVLARTDGDPASAIRGIREAIARLDPQLAPFGTELLTRTVSESLGQRRFAALTLVVFAITTLVLAVVGLYGVVSHAAAQRAREVGIRQALGATPGASVSLILRDTARRVAVALVAGMATAAAGSGLLGNLLFGITRFDLTTFVVVPVGVVAVALSAAAWPAWRVARSAPVTVLHGN
jgi:predicted permease